MATYKAPVSHCQYKGTLTDLPFPATTLGNLFLHGRAGDFGAIDAKRVMKFAGNEKHENRQKQLSRISVYLSNVARQ